MFIIKQLSLSIQQSNKATVEWLFAVLNCKHEIWRNLDWHSQYQNEPNFYQDYRILVFLNLHLFYRYITERFFHWYGFNPPPKKILNPYCFLSHFVKESLQDWKWKFLYKVYRVSIRLHFFSIHTCRERSNYLRRLKLSLLLLPKDTLPRSLLALVSRRL